MKTGNSILAVFFFYMAYYISIDIYIMQRASVIEQEIAGVGWDIWLGIVFGVCLACGIIALATGIERKKKKDKIPDFSVKPSEKKEIMKPESLKDPEKITEFIAVDEDVVDKADVCDIESHVDAITKEKTEK